jgi:hypothetical protein
MGSYQLIGLDQMEASIVRRHLHQWSKTDEQAILPLLTALQQQQYLSQVHIEEPRWETNVYPLYFYWAHRYKVPHREVYERVLASLPEVNVSDLRIQVARIADTEIDILVEDLEYFVFIEAKIPRENQQVKFEKTGGIHQLVRQYVQGKLLAKLIQKPFALATVGANNGQTIKILLNPAEQALCSLVDEQRATLEIPDLAWALLSATAPTVGVAASDFQG